MLVMTEAAAEVVKSVTSGPDAPAGAGLRIVSTTQGPNQPGLLKVSAVEGPAEDDQIIEGNGALVFLESEAAVVLDDKVLDARVDEQGQPYFTVGDQVPGQTGQASDQAYGQGPNGQSPGQGPGQV